MPSPHGSWEVLGLLRITSYGEGGKSSHWGTVPGIPSYLLSSKNRIKTKF